MSEIAESFASSLSDLTVNSKPHINMLTMLAEDHIEFAPVITQTILTHLQKVRPEVKLPVLYLIDSIVKNVGKAYINLFTQSIVQHFTNTFEKVDEKTREQMFKLRQTWNEVFSTKTMYGLDAKVQQIDPAWPLTAPSTVHLNPKFFKASDMLDSKSLSSSTIKQPCDLPQIESRSRHRKSKSYTSRSRSVTNSSQSKKVSSTSSSSGSGSLENAPGSKPSPAPEQLREQMIMKQKMLLELQQQKLKLELLQTQAQLEEQQKQLEKQTINHKTSAELTKLQQKVNQEEAKLKLMNKHLKRQVQLKSPKLQQIHRVTNEMKAQKVAEVNKTPIVPESLVKPAALLELNKDEKPSKPVFPKSKITQLQQVVERQKLATSESTESTEDTPPPVRIAPVSSQLINAALSFGRNVRDPRIRQMSSRLENQLNTVATQNQPNSVPTAPPPSLPVKKPDVTGDAKSYSKSRKDRDKKPSSQQHKEKSSKTTEEESKSHGRISNRSKSSGKLEKSSLTKRSDEKSDRKSKIDDLFSLKLKSPVTIKTHNIQSPSKHSKRDHTSITETVESLKTSSIEKISRIESSPKRSKLQDNWQVNVTSDNNTDQGLTKQIQKLTVDPSKVQSIKQLEPITKISPEPMDSTEMLYEDIEKIVKHPEIISKINKQPEDKSEIAESLESSKSSDDSTEERFNEIIKNPTKQARFDKIIFKVSEDKLKSTKSVTFDTSVDEKLNQETEINTIKEDLVETISTVKVTLKNDIVHEPLSSVLPTFDITSKYVAAEADLQTAENLSVTKHDNVSTLQKTIDSGPKTISICHQPDISKEDPNLDNRLDQENLKLTEIEISTEKEEVSSRLNSISEIQHNINENFIQEEIVTTENVPETEEYVTFSQSEKGNQNQVTDFDNSSETSPIITTQVSNIPVPLPVSSEPDDSSYNLKVTDILNLSPKIIQSPVKSVEPISSNLKSTDRLTLSPNKIQSPVKIVEPMETIEENNENDILPSLDFSSRKFDKKRESPLHHEKCYKEERPSIMEQLIIDAEKHDASPSPPPPPTISEKFKEIKQSSLSRQRRFGRSREDIAVSESPEPADVDLRTQIQPPTLTKDPKNEVLGLADKDVDLRNLPGSPTKKRPSMEKLLDIPPAKKSKAEVMDEDGKEVAQTSVCKIRYFPARPDSTHWYNYSRICVYKRLFGSEDVDLRPVLCPPPPSPPPPPIISSSPPPDNAGERLWARYKQTKPDTYKAKYTPSRRERAPSVDKFGRSIRLNSTEGSGGWNSRGRNYHEDIDMRAQPPGNTDGIHKQIMIQAYRQHTSGDLNADAYKRVLSELVGMREKRQLEEAQRIDERETAQTEHLEPISDEDISGGSLSGVEDAPSPTASYSGNEDFEEPSILKIPSSETQKLSTSNENEEKVPENLGDIDIRMPPGDVDIRPKVDYQPLMEVDEKPVEEKTPMKSRGMSPYSKKSDDTEKELGHSRREELKAKRREKRARRDEDERGSRFRKSRNDPEIWDSHEKGKLSTTENLEAPRVPPLPHFEDNRTYREPACPIPPMFDSPEQQDNPPMRPGPWEPQRMVGPGPGPGPWIPGMVPPVIRAPPVMGMRPQERFMAPRWRQPDPMFEGDHGPRFNRFGPPPIGRFPAPLAPCEVPPTDPTVLKLIEEDPTKSINIDGVPRDIRFYGITAVALMTWDDPREVSFQPGSRCIILDDKSVVLHFNAPPVEMLIDGQPRRVRFGAPTRELFIDNQWYEVFFGAAPVKCDIAGKPHSVQLEGPPPLVRPGVQRKDLVVGKITLIIDAEYLFTIYLDAKPQKFEVKGVSYIIRFVEALQKTVINGVAFKSDFGGLPRPIILNGTKHFFRLTALPRGVTPGFLTIVNMEGGRLPSPPTLPAPPQLPASLEQAVDLKSDAFLKPPLALISAPPVEILKRDVEAPITSLPLPTLPLPVPKTIEPVQPPPAVNPLDMLATLMPAPESNRAVEYSYSVENENSNQTVPISTATDVTVTTTSTVPAFTGEVNVTELLQKLMATGIVPTLDQSKDKKVDKPVTAESSLIKLVDFRKPETLKIRQSALISHLYSGIQCNSCGVRFPPEQTMKYSQHLDWHFRQNRRDKDSSRTAQTRRYYYDVNDWVQFEEIEDLEERAQPWFDMQEGGVEEEEPPSVLVSVRAADYPEDAVCQICHDKFESFYNEEKEEWQLRNAVDQDSKLVHPVCLEDQRAAAEKPIIVEDIDITGDEPKDEETIENKDEEPAKVEEDDDIMEVTDIEFIKPVFPVEDLTVSDTESVTDNNEEKQEITLEEEKLEDENIDLPKDETTKDENMDESVVEVSEETKEEDSKTEAEEKEEESQDDLVLLDKGEDSALSTAEILEVVRNIKKDPDTLGGEYEDIGLDPDVEIKKEKGEVPLPLPVVDTTHASVTCLIDGNVEFEETPQQISVGGPPKIKINITKPNVQTTPKETKDSEVEITDLDTANSSLATLALVNQPPPPGEEPIPQYVKPKLIGRKLQELPPVLKGTELSGLCSIM